MAGKNRTLTDAKKHSNRYTVKKGKIYDSAGVHVTRKEVAADARRAADKAKGNAAGTRAWPQMGAFANRVLQGNAENARDSIREANRQNSKPKKKGKK